MERMRSRAIQLAGIVLLGAVAGLLIMRPWHDDSSTRAPGVIASPPAAATTAPSDVERADVPPPPARTFKLPAMAASVPQVKPREEDAEEEPATVYVPRDWLLRGAGPQHYSVHSDKSEVLSGQVSVAIASSKKDVPSTQSASLMQSVSAQPWLGQRVVFTLNWKSRELRNQRTEVWIRALDGINAVVAYNEAQSLYGKPDWYKTSVAIDVPESATELAYGVTLNGVGAMWVDGAQVQSVDKAVQVPMRSMPSKLGAIAQDARDGGPLAQPSNLDFEDTDEVVNVPEFRAAPADAINRKRF